MRGLSSKVALACFIYRALLETLTVQKKMACRMFLCRRCVSCGIKIVRADRVLLNESTRLPVSLIRGRRRDRFYFAHGFKSVAHECRFRDRIVSRARHVPSSSSIGGA